MIKSIKVMLAGILLIPFASLAINLADCDVVTVSAQRAVAQQGIQDGANEVKGDDQPTELFGDGGIFTTITNTILYVLGAISVIMLIYGGIRYTVSGGESTQVTAAKNTILYAVVGVVVALLAYAIINFVINGLIG